MPPRKRFRPNKTIRAKGVGFPNNPVSSTKTYNVNNNSRMVSLSGHKTRTRRSLGSMNKLNNLQTSLKNLHQSITELLATVHDRNETPQEMIDDIQLMSTDELLKYYLVDKLLRRYKFSPQNFANFAQPITSGNNMSNNL